MTNRRLRCREHFDIRASGFFQIALIGCGGRGTGAARDCLEAAKYINANARLTLLSDVFPDRLGRS
jgi:hypothetical protein